MTLNNILSAFFMFREILLSSSQQSVQVPVKVIGVKVLQNLQGIGS